MTLTNLDIFNGLLRPIIPEAIVQPQSDELKRRLRAKGVLGRHVEVIHEGHHLLSPNWHIHAFRPLLHPALNDVLHIVGGSLYGKETHIDSSFPHGLINM